MARIVYSNVTATLGSPFTGTGTFSTTISSTTVRGTSCLTGKFLYIKTIQQSLPLVSRISIIPLTIESPYGTESNTATLSYGTGGIVYTAITAITSFSATISSTTVRTATSPLTARFNRLTVIPYVMPRLKFNQKTAIKYDDLLVFGAINHRLYMDY